LLEFQGAPSGNKEIRLGAVTFIKSEPWIKGSKMRE